MTPDTTEPVSKSTMIEKAWEAYQRDIPRLSAERPGQWVAYCGDRRIGFAGTRAELWQRCLDEGLPQDEFWVFSIEPILGEEVIGRGLCVAEEQPVNRSDGR